MPRTDPSLSHPIIGYVDLSVTPLSILVPFSPLVHTWRQRRLSPKYQIQNYTVTLNTIPHTSRNTRCHINIPLRHFVSNTNKPKLHESCSTKSKPYSMLQIKNLFLKNFLCCVVKEKFRHLFVLPKNIVLEKLTISRTAIIWILFVYILAFLLLTVMFTLKTFPFDLHFHWRILANLTTIWKVCGLTKPGNKIINHHSNCVTLVRRIVPPVDHPIVKV